MVFVNTYPGAKAGSRARRAQQSEAAGRTGRRETSRGAVRRHAASVSRRSRPFVAVCVCVVLATDTPTGRRAAGDRTWTSDKCGNRIGRRGVIAKMCDTDTKFPALAEIRPQTWLTYKTHRPGCLTHRRGGKGGAGSALTSKPCSAAAANASQELRGGHPRVAWGAGGGLTLMLLTSTPGSANTARSAGASSCSMKSKSTNFSLAACKAMPPTPHPHKHSGGTCVKGPRHWVRE